MATHAHSTPATTPTHSRRRALFAAASAVVMGGGISAGVAASVADYTTLEPDPDTALLSLRPELHAAVLDLGWSEMTDGHSDEKLTAIADRLGAVCWDIVDAPQAQTADGRALKAAAAMYRFRDGFSHGCWSGDGEEMAWNVLSELAGDVYVPPALPERLRANNEPGRA